MVLTGSQSEGWEVEAPSSSDLPKIADAKIWRINTMGATEKTAGVIPELFLFAIRDLYQHKYCESDTKCYMCKLPFSCSVAFLVK